MFDGIFSLFDSAAIDYNYFVFSIIISFLFSGLAVIIAGRPMIYMIKSYQRKGQPIRDDGPEGHLTKKGTPTMGGVIILSSILLSTFLFTDITNPIIFITLFVMFSFAIIGFMDDYSKVVKQNHHGFSPRLKLILQVSISLVALYLISKYAPYEQDTRIFIPFSNVIIDLQYLYFPFAILVITGSSNAVNLTDGLDGLAAGTVSISMLFLGIVAYYMTLPHTVSNAKNVAELLEICILIAAIIGSLIGFLWFNSKPAEIFMGDTGSLALGAAFGIIGIIVKQELLLIMIGGIFVIETLSVMLQVGYFKYSGGKRILKMAPLHHHFEQKGWSEHKIVTRFCIVAFGLGAIALTAII